MIWPWAHVAPQYAQSNKHDLDGLPKPVNVARNERDSTPGVSEEGSDEHVPPPDDAAAEAFGRLADVMGFARN